MNYHYTKDVVVFLTYSIKNYIKGKEYHYSRNTDVFHKDKYPLIVSGCEHMNYSYTKDVVVSGTLSCRSIFLSVSQITPDESGLIWSPRS